DQELALNQLWHWRAFDQHLEGAAEAATISTARGCRDPDNGGLGIEVEQAAIGPSGAVVRLVNDDQISRRQLDRRCPDSATVHGPNRADLHGLAEARRETGQKDAVIDTSGIKLRAGLGDQLAP